MTTETETRPAPAEVPVEPGDDLHHRVCECDDDTALCGVDVSDHPWGAQPGDLYCAVCADLDKLPCERCGAD